jgi:hypothetical protein
MNQEEIKAKSAELAALYTAKANGKTLQYACGNCEWDEVSGMTSPDMRSDLSRWRVKPEPRRMWTTTGSTTFNEAEADEWRVKGYKVTEWLEVLP